MKEGLMEEMAFEMSLNVSVEFHWLRLQKTRQAKVKKLRKINQNLWENDLGYSNC